MAWLDDLLGKRVMQDDTILPDRKILRFVTGAGATLDIADNPSTDDGLGSTDVTIAAGGAASSVTTSQSPTSGDNGTRYFNTSAAGDITINLPASPALGYVLHARIVSAHYIKFLANTGQTIRMDAIVSASAGYVRSNYQGGFMSIEWNGLTWSVTAFGGMWKTDE